MNPKPLPAINYQMRKMTGNRRLGSADHIGQFTNTEFIVGKKKQEATQAGLLRERRVQRHRRYIHEA